MYLYDEEDFGNKYKSNFCNEWLLYLKNNHSITLIERNKSPLAAIHELNEAMCKDIYEIRLKQNVFLNKLHTELELYAKFMKELERRKVVNTKILKI